MREAERVVNGTDPGSAIGDTFTVEDVKRGKDWIEGRTEGHTASYIAMRIRMDADTLEARILQLEEQLEAEGAHTEAANAEIERLKTELAVWKV